MWINYAYYFRFDVFNTYLRVSEGTQTNPKLKSHGVTPYIVKDTWFAAVTNIDNQGHRPQCYIVYFI